MTTTFINRYRSALTDALREGLLHRHDLAGVVDPFDLPLPRGQRGRDFRDLLRKIEAGAPCVGEDATVWRGCLDFLRSA